jgi:NAD(P)-dependent dehydrogenase (short-subunit alcohol dehydrogenase family)
LHDDPADLSPHTIAITTSDLHNTTMSRRVLTIIGTGGMGIACARRLAGTRHLILADYSRKQLDSAVETLTREGFAPEPHIVDVSSLDSVKALAAASSKAGTVDAVVHTAGVSPVTSTAQQIYAVDLLGTAHVIDVFADVMSEGSSLVAVASMAAHLFPVPPELDDVLATAPTDQLLSLPIIKADLQSEDLTAPAKAYGIAKRGNVVRAASAALLYGRRGARINTVSPGIISTAMGRAELEGPSGEAIRALMDVQGVRRVGTAEDIAAAVAWLVGDQSGFVTGSDVRVDGGASTGMRWHGMMGKEGNGGK